MATAASSAITSVRSRHQMPPELMSSASGNDVSARSSRCCWRSARHLLWALKRAPATHTTAADAEATWTRMMMDGFIVSVVGSLGLTRGRSKERTARSCALHATTHRQARAGAQFASSRRDAAAHTPPKISCPQTRNGFLRCDLLSSWSRPRRRKVSSPPTSCSLSSSEPAPSPRPAA